MATVYFKDLLEAMQPGFVVRYTSKSGNRLAQPYKTKDKADQRVSELQKDGAKDISVTRHNLNFKEQNDHEVSMARGELEAIADKATQLSAALQGKSDEGNPLEAWVQSKITKAKDYINSVSDYLMYNPEQKQNEEIEEQATEKEIDKFHKELDKVAKEMKEARWEIEGRVSYKGVGPEDGFHMVIDAPSESAAEDKAYDELEKARKQRKIGPGGGGSIDDMEIEYIEKTNDRLKPVSQVPLGNSYDPTQKEEVNEKVADSIIKTLQKAYAPLKGKTISPEMANKMSKHLDGSSYDVDTLRQLVKANIPFVSTIARNKIYKKTGKFEEVIREEKTDQEKISDLRTARSNIQNKINDMDRSDPKNKTPLTIAQNDLENINLKINQISKKMQGEAFSNALIQKASNRLTEKAYGWTLVSKAKDLAKKFANNMTKAVQEIEKLEKGLSDNPEVYKVLRQYNEEIHPHAKEMAKDGVSDEKIKKMHPEITADELKKLKSEDSKELQKDKTDNYKEKNKEKIEEQIEGIKNKSEKSGVPYGILKQVYDRGMAAWKGGHRPGASQQQWAYARINSFLTKGKTYYTADADLAKKARGAKKKD